MKKLIALLLCFVFAINFSVTAYANNIESDVDDEIILEYFSESTKDTV